MESLLPMRILPFTESWCTIPFLVEHKISTSKTPYQLKKMSKDSPISIATICITIFVSWMSKRPKSASFLALPSPSSRYALFKLYHALPFLDITLTNMICNKFLEHIAVYNRILPVGNRLHGKIITVINRSEVVGRPLAALLANDGAKVYSVDENGIIEFHRGEGLKLRKHEVCLCLVCIHSKTPTDILCRFLKRIFHLTRPSKCQMLSLLVYHLPSTKSTLVN